MPIMQVYHVEDALDPAAKEQLAQRLTGRPDRHGRRGQYHWRPSVRVGTVLASQGGGLVGRRAD